MKRKLWLLNFALIALVAAGGWRLRKEAQDFHARELATPVAHTLGIKELRKIQRRFSCDFETVAL